MFFFYFLFTLFREKGRGEGERKVEKQQCVRGTSVGCLSHAPNWGPGLQPRHVPCDQTSDLSLCSLCSIDWALSARVAQCFSLSILNISSYCLLTSVICDEKSYWGIPALVYMVVVFSCFFPDFLFIWQLNMMHLSMDFLGFIHLGICQALWMCNIFHQIWVVVSCVSSNFFFFAFFFSF